MKEDVLAQLMARRQDYLQHTRQDKSQLFKSVLATFDRRWANLDTRIAMVPGKEVLRQLRQQVQELYRVTLTDARIVESLNRDQIAPDIRTLLSSLDDYRRAEH
jgi:hypothetical protein